MRARRLESVLPITRRILWQETDTESAAQPKAVGGGPPIAQVEIEGNITSRRQPTR